MCFLKDVQQGEETALESFPLVSPHTMSFAGCYFTMGFRSSLISPAIPFFLPLLFEEQNKTKLNGS